MTQFFEDFKQLIKLPSYLFALKFKSKNKNKNIKKIQTKNPLINSPFKCFIETDASFLYKGDKKP